MFLEMYSHFNYYFNLYFIPIYKLNNLETSKMFIIYCRVIKNKYLFKKYVIYNTYKCNKSELKLLILIANIVLE